MARISTYALQIPLFQFRVRSTVSSPSVPVPETLILTRTKYLKISSTSMSVSSRSTLSSVRCGASSSVESNGSSSTKIFIKGLPKSTSEGRLEKAFSEYGEVSQGDHFLVGSIVGGATLDAIPISEWFSQALGEKVFVFKEVKVGEENGSFFSSKSFIVKLPLDKESGQTLGYAYIWFAKEESARLAVKKMNGKFFDGRFIYVTIARPESSKRWRNPAPYKF